MFFIKKIPAPFPNQLPASNCFNSSTLKLLPWSLFFSNQIDLAASIWLEKKRDPFYNSERLTIIFDAINKGDITKIPEYIRSRLILDKGQVAEPKWNNLIYRSKN